MNDIIINPLNGMGRGNGRLNEYHVFVLRMWGEYEDDTSGLRLSIENTHTGQRQGFTDWERMLQFLQQQMKTI
ncbi:MAG: hypothetical protein ACE5EY_08905 [Anaerolineae bacterium]